MRIYLVIIDETEEARVALRFASRRAAKTGGAVHLLSVIEPEPFVAFGGIQATIEQEARDRAEVLLTSLAGAIVAEGGRMPDISVQQGEAVKVVRDYLAAHSEVAALVLGAARDGEPGALVTHFTGPGLGALPCPLMIIPGSLAEDEIDRLS
ncbi:universal stress protein [Novosphingobium terrae]|jgi:nucleotide-binding universal stress UspA family protein|uniref:universal stress protein n=1 Tax=Novosphingobium terrae TaxID=2726189 RepID=UPI001980FD7D|nr:universal stress protein [Novosphingobium terrae]